MSGQPGRSGGHNRRPKFGGGVPAGWPALPASPPLAPVWAPSPEDLEGLQPPGRAFVERIARELVIDYIQGQLVLQAGRALDSLTVWQVEAAINPKAARLAIGFAKLHASLIAQARIR